MRVYLLFNARELLVTGATDGCDKSLEFDIPLGEPPAMVAEQFEVMARWLRQIAANQAPTDSRIVKTSES